MGDFYLFKKGCAQWVVWDGFSLNFIFELFFWIFWKPVENIQFAVKSDKNSDTFYRAIAKFMIISRWILLKPRNASPKICIENQITNFVLNNTVSEDRSFYAIVL